MEVINLNKDCSSASEMLGLVRNVFDFNRKKTFLLSVCVNNYLHYNTMLTNDCRYLNAIKHSVTDAFKDAASVVELCDEDATRDNIFRALIRFESHIEKDSNVLVYFSGLSLIDTKAADRYFVPFGARNLDGFISHKDLFGSVRSIRSSRIFFAYDYQDLKNDKGFEVCKKENKGVHKLIFDKNVLDRKSIDQISFKFMDFLTSKPDGYKREMFLFVKALDKHYPNKYLVNHEGQVLIEDKYKKLEGFLSEGSYLLVINSLKASFDIESPFYEKILKLKLRQLMLGVSDFPADSLNVESGEQQFIASELGLLINIARNNNVTIVIVPESKNSTTMNKRKILVTSANPQDTAWLRLDKEVRKIDEEINKAGYRDSFEVIKLTATRIADLQDALLKHAPNFVHFSGHGCSKGICLVDENDLTDIIPNEPLSKLFSLFASEIECVFLNSCYSSEQSMAIRKSIPKVIGMKDSVNDNTAIEFAAAFYKAIASNRSVDFSYQFAINSIDLNKLDGSDIPVLLS